MHSSIPVLLSSFLLHHSAGSVRCPLTCPHLAAWQLIFPSFVKKKEKKRKTEKSQSLDSSTACWVMMSMPVSSSHYHRALSKHAALLKVDEVIRCSVWTCVLDYCCVTDVPGAGLQAVVFIRLWEEKKWEGGSDVERDGAVGGGVHLLPCSWLESWQRYKAAERNLSLLYVGGGPFFTHTSGGCIQRITSGERGLTLYFSFAFSVCPSPLIAPQRTPSERSGADMQVWTARTYGNSRAADMAAMRRDFAQWSTRDVLYLRTFTGQ